MLWRSPSAVAVPVFAGPGAEPDGADEARSHLAAVPADERGANPKGAPARVLVADDEPSMRALCRVNLQLEGLEVLEASDGEEALALATGQLPDLVLLDVMMPGLDGWEVARRLEARPATRDIPIVFMTALAAPDDRSRGIAAGAVGYLVKPFDPLRLGSVVRRTLERVARGEREALRREIEEDA